MAGWVTHRGQAVHLPVDNVDTDQLIPARFMSVPRVQGYGPYLMHDLRRGQDEALVPEFPLNAAPGASILIAGQNFGSGSSREAAVYALVDAGFRCVIAPSFGDIFAGNAVNNGLLPAVLPAQQIEALVSVLRHEQEVQIDLQEGQVTCGTFQAAFVLDAGRRVKLINGWDDIDVTAQHSGQIARYRKSRATNGWVWPKG